MYLSTTAVTRSSRCGDVPDEPEDARASWLPAAPMAATPNPSAITTTAVRRMKISSCTMTRGRIRGAPSAAPSQPKIPSDDAHLGDSPLYHRADYARRFASQTTPNRRLRAYTNRRETAG